MHMCMYMCYYKIIVLKKSVLNYIFRHYLIPYNVAKRGRLGKRGTKLHIYMDHIFVAQRIKG
jgi:hypothetical protein